MESAQVTAIKTAPRGWNKGFGPHTGPEDLVGRRFGLLTVVQNLNYGKVVCECDCGVRKEFHRANIKAGKSKSCGCYRTTGAPRKGISKSALASEYRAWSAMLHRCDNPNNSHYDKYGGRGITVCERWRKLENFLTDMGPRPSKDHSIDRIDNDGNYEPGNCRWATRTEQQNNRRCTALIEWRGHTRAASEWAREMGWPRHVLPFRLSRGWSVERALSTPARRYQSRRDAVPERIKGVSFRPDRPRPWVARSGQKHIGYFETFAAAKAAVLLTEGIG